MLKEKTVLPLFSNTTPTEISSTLSSSYGVPNLHEASPPAKDSSLAVDDKFDEAEMTKHFFIEPKTERILRQQKEMIEE
jgi:hypothetical protein